MPSAAITALGIIAALICVRGPARLAAVTLIGALFLVPDQVPLGIGPASFTILRLLVWASSIGLLVRVSAREMRTSALRPGRTHVALLGFVLVAYLVGVSWAPWPTDFHSGFDQWLVMLDQLLFLWCMVAYARTLGTRWLATVVVLFATASAGIGVLEKVSKGAYSHWWYKHTKVSVVANGTGPLELRGVGGSIRVRAQGEFALQYGWIMAMLIPLTCSMALIVRRWFAWLAPPLLVCAVVFSVSRSAFAGIALGALVWVLCSRLDRRALFLACAGGLLGAGLYFGFHSLHHAYSTAAPGSVISRTRRAQLTALDVEHRSLTGVGLAGLGPRGLTGTDSFFVLTYTTMGVVGLLGLTAALGTPLVTSAVGALRGRGDERLIAAGAAAGMAAAVVSLAAFDALSGPSDSWVFWLLAAIGIVAAEEATVRRDRRLRPSPLRLAVPVAGVAIGLVATAATSPRVASVSKIVTLSAAFSGGLNGDQSNFQLVNPAGGNYGVEGDPSYAGVLLVNSACQQGRLTIGPHVKLVCIPFTGIGAGLMVLSGSNATVVSQALAKFDLAGGRISSDYRRSAIEVLHDRSTPIRTSPFYLGVGGAVLMILMPPLPVAEWRERRRRAPALIT